MKSHFDIPELEFIGFTSIWNFHNVSLTQVSLRKGSNIYKSLIKIREQGYNGLVTIVVESIGRSGHSPSRVALYKGVTNYDECNFYYSGRLAEVRTDIL